MKNIIAFCFLLFSVNLISQSSSDGPCGNCFNYLLVDDNSVEFDLSMAFYSHPDIIRREMIITSVSSGQTIQRFDVNDRRFIRDLSRGEYVACYRVYKDDGIGVASAEELYYQCCVAIIVGGSCSNPPIPHCRRPTYNGTGRNTRYSFNATDSRNEDWLSHHFGDGEGLVSRTQTSVSHRYNSPLDYWDGSGSYCIYTTNECGMAKYCFDVVDDGYEIAECANVPRTFPLISGEINEEGFVEFNVNRGDLDDVLRIDYDRGDGVALPQSFDPSDLEREEFTYLTRHGKAFICLILYYDPCFSICICFTLDPNKFNCDRAREVFCIDDKLRFIPEIGSNVQGAGNGDAHSDVIDFYTSCDVDSDGCKNGQSVGRTEFGSTESLYMTERISRGDNMTIDIIPLSPTLNVDLFVGRCTDLTNPPQIGSCVAVSSEPPGYNDAVFIEGREGTFTFVVDGQTESPVNPNTEGNYEIAVTCGNICDYNPDPIECGIPIRDSNEDSFNWGSYYCPCDTANNKAGNYGPEKVYKFSLDAPSEVSIYLDVIDNVDLNLYLLDSCASSTCFARSKSDLDGGDEQIIEFLEPGEYYVVVEGYRGDFGEYELLIDGCSSCFDCYKYVRNDEGSYSFIVPNGVDTSLCGIGGMFLSVNDDEIYPAADAEDIYLPYGLNEVCLFSWCEIFDPQTGIILVVDTICCLTIPVEDCYSTPPKACYSENDSGLFTTFDASCTTGSGDLVYHWYSDDSLLWKATNDPFYTCEPCFELVNKLIVTSSCGMSSFRLGSCSKYTDLMLGYQVDPIIKIDEENPRVENLGATARRFGFDLSVDDANSRINYCIDYCDGMVDTGFIDSDDMGEAQLSLVHEFPNYGRFVVCIKFWCEDLPAYGCPTEFCWTIDCFPEFDKCENYQQLYTNDFENVNNDSIVQSDPIWWKKGNIIQASAADGVDAPIDLNLGNNSLGIDMNGGNYENANVAFNMGRRDFGEYNLSYDLTTNYDAQGNLYNGTIRLNMPYVGLILDISSHAIIIEFGHDNNGNFANAYVETIGFWIQDTAYIGPISGLLDNGGSLNPVHRLEWVMNRDLDRYALAVDDVTEFNVRIPNAAPIAMECEFIADFQNNAPVFMQVDNVDFGICYKKTRKSRYCKRLSVVYEEDFENINEDSIVMAQPTWWKKGDRILPNANDGIDAPLDLNLGTNSTGIDMNGGNHGNANVLFDIGEKNSGQYSTSFDLTVNFDAQGRLYNGSVRAGLSYAGQLQDIGYASLLLEFGNINNQNFARTYIEYDGFLGRQLIPISEVPVLYSQPNLINPVYRVEFIFDRDRDHYAVLVDGVIYADEEIQVLGERKLNVEFTADFDKNAPVFMQIDNFQYAVCDDCDWTYRPDCDMIEVTQAEINFDRYEVSWQIDDPDIDVIGYQIVDLTTNDTTDLDFGNYPGCIPWGDYILCVLYIDDDGCVQVCCRRWCGYLERDRCSLFSVQYKGDDDYIFELGDADVIDLNWTVDGVDRGNQSIQDYKHGSSESFEVCLIGINEVDGCIQVCCQQVCPPVRDCDAYRMARNMDGTIELEWTSSATDITWFVEDIGVELGSGSSLDFHPDDYPEMNDRMSVIICCRYFANGCWQSCCRRVDIRSSASEDVLEPNIQVYPVPAHDVLVVDIPVELDEIRILDTQGRIMELSDSIQEGQNRFNIGNLSSGFYLIELRRADQIWYKQFIKN